MRAKVGLLSGTAVLLMAAPLPALAQTSSAAAPAASESAVEEIIVTGEKREERLIEVPQSITAVTADDLARLNATQLRDYANTVPALTVTSGGGAGQATIAIRGVTSGNDVASTVGVYVDEVPYSGSTVFSTAVGLALDAGLFDLDRIEVLRGPQGTLYGASAMGGLLKYVTRTPDANDYDAVVQGGASFTEHGGANYNGAGAVNIPIVNDQVGLRASGYYSRDGGYISNVQPGFAHDDQGRANIYGGRLDLLIRPRDNLSIRLTGFAQNIDRDGAAFADYNLSGQPVDGELDQRRVLPETFSQRFRLASGTVTYDFGPATLTSVSSYQTSDVTSHVDATALYGVLLAPLGLPLRGEDAPLIVSTDKFAQEVRLASSGGQTFDWIVGGFYTHEDSNAQVNLVAIGLNGAPFPLNLLTSHLPSTYEEGAVFGDLTWHVTDKLDLTGGLRYARNHQSYQQNATSDVFPIGNVPTRTSSENVTTYLANARYHFSDHAVGYLRYATGYRPGGPNVVTFDPVTGNPLGPPTFKSDTLSSYEVGFKAETDHRAYGIDVAAYHIDWADMLISFPVNGFQAYRNAGSAAVDGAELTLTARPFEGLTLSGAFAYQFARLTEDAPNLGGHDNERLPNVPHFTAAVNADYAWDLLGFAVTTGATVRFVSDRRSGFYGFHGAPPPLPQYDLGSYTTLDLRAGTTLGPVDAQLFVRNVFDDRGQVSASTSAATLGGPAWVSLVQPRTIGVSLTSHF